MVKWDECRRIRSYLYVCAAPVGKKHYIPLYIDTHADFNLLGQEGLSLGACNVAYYERLMPIYLFAFCLFFSHVLCSCVACSAQGRMRPRILSISWHRDRSRCVMRACAWRARRSDSLHRLDSLSAPCEAACGCRLIRSIRLSNTSHS